MIENQIRLMGSDVRRAIVQPVSKAKRDPVEHARSVPHKEPFVKAVLLSGIHYMGLLAAATTLIVFVIEPTQLGAKVFFACLVFSVFSWLIAYFKRKHTYCPLCKGTPLINSGALAHNKAFRLYPLNHGVTATLSIIATQKFRCMYCGNPYDLLKTPSHKLPNEQPKYKEDYTAYTSYTPDE